MSSLSDLKDFKHFIQLTETGNTNSNEDEDIIILDDDDFIQTTLNLLEKFPKFEDNTIENHKDLNQDNEDQILIDLTSDFDLNDLFLIHSNNTSQHFSVNEKHEFKMDQQIIKNEFDFKEFNFNFESCMDEILIDDDNLKANIQEDNLNNETFITNLNNFNDGNISSILDSHDSINSLPIENNDESFNKNKNKKVYECEECSKDFDKSYNYKRHVFMHKSHNHDNIKTKNFQVNECQNCKRRILDKSNYSKHVKKCRQKFLKNRLYMKTDNDNLINQTSNLVNQTKPSVFINIELKESNKCSIGKHEKFECDICQKVFNKKFNYHRHLRVHFLNEVIGNQHDQINMNSLGSNGQFNECDKCKRKFNEKKQLTIHQIKWHMTEYNCELCTMKFTEKFEYIKHLNSIHTMKFKFECKHCAKSFRYLSHYIEHRRIHKLPDIQEENSSFDISESSRLKCFQCGKLFTKRFNLNRHIMGMHKIDKPKTSQMNEIDFENDLSTAKMEIETTSVSVENELVKNDGVIDHKYNRLNRLKYDCNNFQKKLYEENKLNFHLNKVHIDN